MVSERASERKPPPPPGSERARGGARIRTRMQHMDAASGSIEGNGAYGPPGLLPLLPLRPLRPLLLNQARTPRLPPPAPGGRGGIPPAANLTQPNSNGEG